MAKKTEFDEMLERVTSISHGMVRGLSALGRKIEIERRANDLLARTKSVNLQGVLVGLIVCLLIASIPVTLDGTIRERVPNVDIHESLLAIERRPAPATPARYRPANGIETEAGSIAPNHNIDAPRTLTALQQSESLAVHLSALRDTEEGSILADAINAFQTIDSTASDQVVASFSKPRQPSHGREIDVSYAAHTFGIMLESRGLYVSLLSENLVPRLIELELAFYRAYRAEDPVACGEIPLLVDLKHERFPTPSLEVAAHEIALLKSRDSIFALDKPVLRSVATDSEIAEILSRASEARSSVASSVWDFENESYEELMTYQCDLAISALEYLNLLDSEQQVRLYEEIFGTRFMYVTNETHHDELLPERVMMFLATSSND